MLNLFTGVHVILWYGRCWLMLVKLRTSKYGNNNKSLCSGGPLCNIVKLIGRLEEEKISGKICFGMLACLKKVLLYNVPLLCFLILEQHFYTRNIEFCHKYNIHISTPRNSVTKWILIESLKNQNSTLCKCVDGYHNFWKTCWWKKSKLKFLLASVKFWKSFL